MQRRMFPLNILAEASEGPGKWDEIRLIRCRYRGKATVGDTVESPQGTVSIKT